MSFQAYLDNIEKKTGKTPNDFIALAKQKGFTAKTKATEIATWLKSDYELGHGRATAMVRVIKHGPRIKDTHVGAKGSHGDESDELRLDGSASR